MKIKKGDQVEVIAGKDKGKRGEVLTVDRKKNRVVVEGVNIVHRHMRPSQDNPQGGIIENEAPVDASNVMVVCAACDEKSRLGYKYLDNGNKVRYCKKCDETIE